MTFQTVSTFGASAPVRSRLAARLTGVAATVAIAAAFAFGATAPAAAQEHGCAKVAGTLLGNAKRPAYTATTSANLNPPLDIAAGQAFFEYMIKNRGDDRAMLEQKWNRYVALVRVKDLTGDREKRAFLVTPREEFSRTRDANNTYLAGFLDIGCGVTISGSSIVAYMTQVLDVKPGEKALEIGTGSGYQSAMLAQLTDKVFTIEIIPALGKFTEKLQTELAKTNFGELAAIKRKIADGYYGWEEHAPFDKIIVTAGIDHIPPPLLKQLKVGGMMLIPVGQPGCQSVLKITKELTADGKEVIKRHDIYENRRVTCARTTFVAFTKYDDKGQTKARFGTKAEDK